jgi:phosphatidylserine/phosphatidylglycerophosphate/cardiolipin synthase-like enzyme
MKKTPAAAALLILVSVAVPRSAAALERLCDPSFEDCRTEILELIGKEQVEILVGAWFFEDSRFSNDLAKRAREDGLSVRVLADPRATPAHPNNGPILDQLAGAGIPIRKRITAGIEHWKLMLFVGQKTVYFGSANYSPYSFVPEDSYRNYTDETIYVTDDPAVVNTLITRFEDAWIDTVAYADHANAPNTTLARRYPIHPIDPELNFAPASGSANYRTRSVTAYNAETEKIDVIMYRITDQAHVDAIIAAFRRGVPVRVYTEQVVYRQTNYIWHSMSVDKMWAAGIPIRIRGHLGQNHQKSVLLYSQKMTIFGSSNWTTSSADRQHEHNYFTKKPHIFQWFVDQFERKWHNTNPVGAAETIPFVPQPPTSPVNKSPANGAVGVATSGTKLTWHGGLWAHLYDVHFGTSPNPPLIAENVALGPSRTSGENKSFTLPPLAPGTTYYWKITSKTMAYLARTGPVWSFTTAGSTPPSSNAATIVLWPSDLPATALRGDWVRIADPTAAGGAAVRNPDRGRVKIVPALASPSNYFEMTFDALRGVPYHLWIRMRAEGDALSNDSVHVQFSDSVDSVGTPVMRIGTTSSAEPVLQNGPGGAAPREWGWTDNGWGTLGQAIYFAADGAHIIRIQQREDGAALDQIVLSPNTYFDSPPGTRRDDTTILPAGGGTSTPPASDTVVIWTANIPADRIRGNWAVAADSTAAGSAALRNADIGGAKIVPAMANPVSYFETTFNATAGVAYHLWIRGRADANSMANDSVHVQFDDSIDGAGAPLARIGTTSSLETVLQDGSSGPAPDGWGWTENGWGAHGPHVYFETTGQHRIRIQQREDGMTVDQIVLSPDTYLNVSPGARRNDTTVLPAIP